ncbi:hypothetical protein FO489_23250, partial [Bacillus licheniformis]
AGDVSVIAFKLEFDLDKDGEVLLADDISPDTFRLWAQEIYEKLDKDVFRRHLGGLTVAYAAIFKRLGGMYYVQSESVFLHKKECIRSSGARRSACFSQHVLPRSSV